MILTGKASLDTDPKCKVALVSFPWQSNAPYKLLSDVLKILDPLCERIVVIDGNTDRISVASERVELHDIGVGVHYLYEKKPRLYSGLLWISKCILAQIRTCLELAKIRRDVDVVVFYQANPFYIMAVITSKLLRKGTIDIVTRSKRKDMLSRIMNLQDPILFKIFDGISPQTPALIDELRLTKYQNKLLPESARFIDTSYYRTINSIEEREQIVGFVGRLDKGKGVAEFIDAIPLVSKSHNNVKFLIGGSGKMSHFVEEQSRTIVDSYGIDIEITGWIAEGLPDYLNKLKLFVLPTQSDAFPTSVLEAMACGTPVLASAKGGIIDVIKDEETGFIMEDTTPEVIAENITRALSYRDLDRISANARDLIEEKFTYEKAVERWRQILAFSVGESHSGSVTS